MIETCNSDRTSVLQDMEIGGLQFSYACAMAWLFSGTSHITISYPSESMSRVQARVFLPRSLVSPSIWGKLSSSRRRRFTSLTDQYNFCPSLLQYAQEKMAAA